MKDELRSAMERYFEAMPANIPAAWEQLPDIGLYMDQVVTYLEKQLGFFRGPDGENAITPSMINNYAKAKVIPRAGGKKYGQEHIARLLSVFMLKRVLSMKDLTALFEGLELEEDIRGLYGSFRRSMEESSSLMAEAAKAYGEAEEVCAEDISRVRSLALKLAVDASLRSFAAERLLDMIGSARLPDGKEKEQKQKTGGKGRKGKGAEARDTAAKPAPGASEDDDSR